ncbi:hypothetical protein Tco_0304598 [Tanacetum coccineum]
MSAVDQRLNIMSGGGSSSNKATLNESASAKELKSDSPLFLVKLQVGMTGIIFVMLGRTWDVSVVTGRYLSTNMVVSDVRGNAIHCSARRSAVLGKMMRSCWSFNSATSARKSLDKGDGFVSHPFQLVELDSVELTNNKYMIDVAGYISNVGRSIQQRTCSRTLDFYLANERGQMLRVILWEFGRYTD